MTRPAIGKALKVALTLLALYAFAAACPRGAAAEEVQKTVAVGVADVYGPDKALARDNAIRDAKKKAVEQAMGVYIDAQTKVQNYQVIDQKIFSKTDGYIKNYQVLSEGPGADGLYEVKIEADVAMTDLKDDLLQLCIAIENAHRPRTMFLVSEQNIGQTAPQAWWTQGRAAAMVMDLGVAENTLIEAFASRCFPLIDRKAAAQKIAVSGAMGVTDLSTRQIQELGNQLAAEMVVYGQAVANEQGQNTGLLAGTGMKSAIANVSLRCVKTDTGEILASATTSAPAVHVDVHTAGARALKLATAKAATELIRGIIERGIKPASTSGMVKLEVDFGGDMRKLVMFRKLMKARLRGVSEVHQRGVKSGVATLEVTTEGVSGQEFGDELIMKDWEDFTVNVTEMTANTIKMTLAPK